jgi:translation initiation factor IF-2
MTMLTVDDLARDLKVRNEDLLRELVTMGFEVEGPESHLETDDPAALRAQLVTILPQREVVEQRIRPTVIRRRMKKGPQGTDRMDVPARPALGPEPEAPPTAEKPHPPERPEPRTKEAAKTMVKKIRKAEPARIIEMAPKPEPESTREESAAVEAAAQMPQAVTPPPLSEGERRGDTTGSLAREVAPGTVAPSSPPAEPVRTGAGAAEASAGPVGQTAQGLTPEMISTPPGAGSATEAPPSVVGEEALSAEERRAASDKLAKKKKKKEKRIQPAQIIGRVELKKEPPKEPERPEPVRVARPEPPARPSPPAHAAAAIPLVPDVMTEEERRQKKKKEKRGRDTAEPAPDTDVAMQVRRRKEVILKEALYDDRQRGSRSRGKGKKPKLRKTEITQPKASKRRIKIPETVTVANLAHKMSVKGTEVIRHLLAMGMAASLNEGIDFETAVLVGTEFGFETEPVEQAESELLPANVVDTLENVVPRPPVVTVMGHVDHGKTSLLDGIRSTHVTDQEAGGITQHIGAYTIKVDKGELVFLDTPGHEAFTAMRARGAQVTDFVVLVVAADDGVMDQTKEAINHSKAAGVPIIVAVNKMDKPEADKDRVTRELSEFGLIPESWGGETLFCYVSAKTGMGITELLDTILLQAEMMELKANPNKQATGTVIEARLDKGKGPVGTVLIKEGTLKLGDPFVSGTHHGKVRAMLDYEGRSLETAGPATPVEIQGFSGVPDAGDSFIVVDEEKIARQVSVQRQQKLREHEVASMGPASLEDLMARMQEQEVKELLLIVKADVQGSAEALKEALLAIPSHQIKVKVVHSGVGTITESDVMLAAASGAIIIGFNVRPTPKTTQLAEQEKVDIRLYSIIYEALEDVRKAMEGMLAPIEKETVMGRAEVIQLFSVPKIGVVAGCHVRSGKIERSNQVRLIRDDRAIYQGKISSMKRFKDDIKEALEGYECGIGLENYRDIKLGDMIEAFVIEKESAKLT